jgi:hypothetical protein
MRAAPNLARTRSSMAVQLGRTAKKEKCCGDKHILHSTSRARKRIPPVTTTTLIVFTNMKAEPAVDNDHNDTCHDYESGYRWLHECGSERRDINQLFIHTSGRPLLEFTMHHRCVSGVCIVAASRIQDSGFAPRHHRHTRHTDNPRQMSNRKHRKRMPAVTQKADARCNTHTQKAVPAAYVAEHRKRMPAVTRAHTHTHTRTLPLTTHPPTRMQMSHKYQVGLHHHVFMRNSQH